MSFSQQPWPPITSTELNEHLLIQASDYSLSHGLVLRPPAAPNSSPSTTTSIHAPYSLFPSPFPKKLFEEAKGLQVLYNSLYSHVAVDEEFLEEVVGGTVAKVDEFQEKLFEIWRKVTDEGIKQPLQLGLFRSDYLLHCPVGSTSETMSIKQVEFNTISSSFGALATKVGDMHRYLQKSGSYPISPELNLDVLPVNEALQGLARGLAAGHKAYGVNDAKILMVTQDNERNSFDQRALEWELLETHSISTIRLPFSILNHHATLTPNTSTLLITHPSLPVPTEISVVYYRAGYTPTDYTSSISWNLRLLLERSLAIKCPSLGLQLAGAKKVQQVLTDPLRLMGFSGIGSSSTSTSTTSNTTTHSALSPKDLFDLSNSFTSLYPMDNSPLGQLALSLAYSNPTKFVLKPQREGGGNNIYREAIPPFLDSLDVLDKFETNTLKPKAREAYILMDLILPPTGIESIMVRAGEDKGIRGEVVSELGIFGIALFKKREGKGERGAEMLVNEMVGHLLRTKGVESDEGGVAVGFSVIDSPLLY